MLGNTHRIIGLATGVAAGLITLNPNTIFTSAMNAFVISASSTLPDIDLKLGIKHRGITHSLAALSIGTAVMGAFLTPAALPFFVGYGMHILADSLTVTGVQLFWPHGRMYGLKILRTGKRKRGE
jgi:inner membrane protein